MFKLQNSKMFAILAHMRICNLSSGSDGNLTYVETEEAKVLVDAGLSCTEILKRLSLLNVKGEQIDAILVTHEHGDHIKGIEVFVKKFNTRVYVHKNGYNALIKKLPKLNATNFILFDDMEFLIYNLKVQSVKLPHDSVYCSGFILKENTKKISILTDLGYTSTEVIEKVKGSTLVYLEANHDENLLRNNLNYPASLKARILGKSGHLSNISCAQVIKMLCENGTKQVMLSHLSRENNTPELAYTCICTYLSKYGIVEGKNIRINVATTLPSAIFTLK